MARHDAGDMPTEGVRTAPTPSQPPTPCLEQAPSIPPLREEVEESQENEKEENEEEVNEVEKKVEKIVEKEKDMEVEKEETKVGPAPPDLLSETGVERREERSDDNSSTHNLDVVPPPIRDSDSPYKEGPPDMPDTLSGRDTPLDMTTPPDMDTPPEMGTPELDLPDAPEEEPGSPEQQAGKP